MLRTHSRRIGPGTLVVLAALSLAAFEVAGFDPVSPAFAQTPAPVTLSGLFDPDQADLKTTEQLKDAIKKAPRGCYPPRVTFTVGVVSGPGDPSFAEALAKVRGDFLQQALPGLGLAPGQFKTGWATLGQGNDYVQVSYDKFKPEDDKDKEGPALKVTWVPSKGKKVKVGDKITVTITASERYEDGHKSWPTGVRSIQLLADDGSVDSKDYPNPTQPCASRTFPATYIVKPSKLPSVHLTALVEDGAGNPQGEVAEFPMGDVLKGKLSSTTTSKAGMNPGVVWSTFHTDAILSLTLLPDGTVSGTADVTYSAHAEGSAWCNLAEALGPYSWTIDPSPAHLRAKVTGTVTSSGIDFQMTSEAPFEAHITATACKEKDTVHSEQDMTGIALGVVVNWQVKRDGQAYTWQEQAAGQEGTSWTIRLEPQK